MQSALNERMIDFWHWFRDAATPEKAQDPEFLKALDDRISELSPQLSWEIGPGFSQPWRFVISPNLDHHLRETAREIIARAPVLPGWEFYSTRQPKEWNYQVELIGNNGNPIYLDASNWTFVLLRYPDATHEILLKGQNLPELEDDERWQAAAITLESILGEDLMMDRINEFELVENLGSEFANKDRPIQQLRNAIVGKG
jgi:hypothetical protein